MAETQLCLSKQRFQVLWSISLCSPIPLATAPHNQTSSTWLRTQTWPLIKRESPTRPPTAEGQATAGRQPASLGIFGTPAHHQPWPNFLATATSGTAPIVVLASTAKKKTLTPDTIAGPGTGQSWAYQPVMSTTTILSVLGLDSPQGTTQKSIVHHITTLSSHEHNPPTYKIRSHGHHL